MGTKLGQPATAREAITAAGLDYEVKLASVNTFNGLEVPKTKAVVRQDKGLRRFLKEKVGWYRHTMKSKAKEVTFSVCVCYKTYLHHRTSKRCKKKLIYAAWGVRGAPVELREMYRKRFGIETSYRQRREARIRTCTRDPKLRLFYVGISLLLRNVWVLLHATLLADGDDIHPEPCLEKLRYADLLEWLSDFIKTLLAVSIGFRIDCDTGKRVTAEEVT